MSDKTCFFSIADDNNKKYFDMMAKTLHHFHPYIKLLLFDQKDIEATKDPSIFYRATPYFANKLFNAGFDHVIKLDSDQLILGNLDYILGSDHDVGTVLNWNRVDPSIYGEVGIATIPPQMYFNCGLVSLKSKDFVQHWLNMCYSPHFMVSRYKEQDLLNLLCHYGNYVVRCFDMPDNFANYRAWHGLKSKGETMKMVMKDGKVILPKGADNYPEADTEIKVFHEAGGNNPQKLQYRNYFTGEVLKYIDNILNEQTPKKDN